jgi:subtilisin family serine protease
LTHQEFADRIAPGFDAFVPGGDADDCHGHGTHVAGTVGGTSYGVAKQTTLVPVRVLDCDGFGPYSDIIAGIEWVAANADGPSVANMSLGGPVSQSVNDAVAAAVASGVTFVVSAGNEGEDACDFSPAAEATAITVGAVDYNDSAAIWSNSGACVDLFAPGVSITSAGYRGDDAFTMMSGTSMASPHVAGVAALYLTVNPEAAPDEVTRAILDNAVTDVIDNPDGSPNRMLYAGFIGG